MEPRAHNAVEADNFSLERAGPATVGELLDALANVPRELPITVYDAASLGARDLTGVSFMRLGAVGENFCRPATALQPEAGTLMAVLVAAGDSVPSRAFEPYEPIFLGVPSSYGLAKSAYYGWEPG